MRYFVTVKYEVEPLDSPGLTPALNRAIDVEAIEADAKNALGRTAFPPLDTPEVEVEAQD